MRLLRVEAPELELVEFYADIPPYAILSHRWEAEELLYNDVERKNFQKAGFHKIRQALVQARNDGFKYLWVDTCCIDKTNSSELSEAINSMFRWYQNADVCYAYLSDVAAIEPDLESSQWFSRGWTLQELLAPLHIVFFSCDWEPIGSKATLVERLSVITGIDREILQGTSKIFSASIAQRMSWAAKRTTTRVEDMSYCLLGIFDVNLPLIYGEGENAFLRLQEQIANASDDQTLFAWVDPAMDNSAGLGMLAQHPRCFLASGYYVPCYDPQSSEPYSINKRRLKIEARLQTQPHGILYGWRVSELALLSCVDTRYIDKRVVAIGLSRITGSRREFRRTCCSRLFHIPCSGTLTTILVPQTLSDVPTDRLLLPPDYAITIRSICQDSLTRAELIGYTCDGAVHARNNHLSTNIPVQKISRFSRLLAMRDTSRCFFGESSPEKVAVELHFVVHRVFDTDQSMWIKKKMGMRVVCGMTAGLELGFDVVYVSSITQEPRRTYSLVPWDEKTPVKISESIRHHYTFEFIPVSTCEIQTQHRSDVKLITNHTFDLKITSER